MQISPRLASLTARLRAAWSSPHPASAYLRGRWAWFAGAALLGLVARCGAEAPPARTVEGVAAMLGAAVGGEVRPEDFVWEGRGGFLADAFVGRRVLFLARSSGGPRDLYRARVRLTRAGRPLGVRDVRDLTKSPDGDEGDLVAQGHAVAYTTRAGGAVQGVTLLDLGGADAPEASLAARARLAADRWIATGDARGIGRTEVVFRVPPPEAKIELEGDLLVFALGREAVPAALHVATRALDTGDRDPFGARAHHLAAEIPSWSAFTRARTLELFGPAAAAWVATRLRPHESGGGGVEPMPSPRGAPVASAADGWPPSGVSWSTPEAAILPAPGEKDAPPYFVEAEIPVRTPRGARTARLVAIDTRRVDLRLEAGTDAPRSTTGLHGLGQLPTGAAGARVVAVFATGPDGADDALLEGSVGARAPERGVVVERAPLVPPRAGARTLAFGRDGAIRYGAWTSPDLPPWLASLRQVPDASGPRSVDRLALCTLPSGHVVYAFARGVDGPSLEAALEPLGCAAVLPLASAPADVGFAFVRAPAEVGADWEAAPLVPGSPIDGPALARGLRGDFAYAVLHEARPPRDPNPGAPAAGSAAPRGSWVPDPGKQPAPTFIPAIFSATVVELGAQVHLVAFLPGRFTFALRAGTRELGSRTGAPLAGALDDGELGRALAAFGLGAAKRKVPRGFATGGAAGLHFRGDAGALVVDGERVRVVKSDGFTPPARADAAELPLTADDGKLRPEAREVGTMRPRAAACALDDGTFMAASTTFDNDEATTQALLDAGCARVVALDRGSHPQAFAHRAGGETPPERRYDASALYVLEAPLRGRAAPL